MGRRWRGWLWVVLLGAALAPAQQQALWESTRAKAEVALETDPASPFWQAAPPLVAESDRNGRRLPLYRTEVRSRWTRQYLYFLFVCPYRQLYLNPAPHPTRETYALWQWNVAEVFIGSDFTDIDRYKEFELSPQNEWVDLDINLHSPHHEDGWLWNSGFEHEARVDSSSHIWYAAMRIPWAALSPRPVAAGTVFRVNVFRTEGPPGATQEVMWRPTLSSTFHVPERFGLLRLVAR